MHDINRVTKDLNDALGREKGTIGFLLGAGCPTAIRVPDGKGGTKGLIPAAAGLAAIVAQQLGDDPSYKHLLEQFRVDGVEQPSVEEILTQARTLLRVVGKGEARGLDSDRLKKLETAVCKSIFGAAAVDLPSRDTPYHKLYRWVRDADRTEPVTVFTTNYDLLSEQALEEEEVPFFDGFSGAKRPFFNIRAMESDQLPPRWVRLWKLHGSINWKARTGEVLTVIRSVSGAPDEGDLLIHPSELKYDQSRRMPYLAMFDRLRAFLREGGAVLVTCGYSFSDDHLNEVMLQGLAGNPGATVFGLLFGTFDMETAAAKLMERAPANLVMLARDGALVRRRRATWAEPDTPRPTRPGDTAEAAAAPALEFHLGDFGKFGSFLETISGRAAGIAPGGA